MDDDGPTASIILFLLFLLIDIFFFGFGSAVKRLNEKEVERRAEEEQDKKSIRLTRIINHPSEYINTVQLVITLINVVIGAFYLTILKSGVEGSLARFAENRMQDWKVPAGVVAGIATVFTTVFLLYIVLTLGVLLPKRIAAQVPEKWAYACVNPVWYVVKFLSPLTGLVTVTVQLLLRLFGIRASGDESDVTEEEILDIVNEGHEQGLLEASEAEMITNIIEFGDKEAGDIMTHRNNMLSIDGSQTLRDAIAFMLEEKSSRYPVYEENIDNIIGILYLKDSMRFHMNEENADKSLKDLEGLLRDAYFVPETKNIDELFKEMRAKHLQMVIVIDEYGQTEGLVTMEDILEEIVGNILDEYDEDDQYIEEKGNDEYIIEGMTPLEELEERFQISFEEEEFETLNGFLISKMDRLPEENEHFGIDVGGYHFQILTVENKMIASVLVKKLPSGDSQKDSEHRKED